MKNKIALILSYIIIFLNSHVLSEENDNNLKVGLLAPLSGQHKELGNSLLYSLQLALEEIDDAKLTIVPRDSGFKDKQKLNTAIQEIKSQGARIIIGPISFEEFDEVKKFNDMIFISPSNMQPKFVNKIAVTK